MLKPVFLALIISISVSLGGCLRHNKDISEYLVRAEQFKSEGNNAKARVELQKAFQISPADPQLNLKLAEAEEDAGNLQDAIPFYARAAEPEAHLLEAQLRIIEVLLDSNRLQDAAGRINLTLGAFPNESDAIAMRADLEERRGELFEAKSDATAVLVKKPADARALAVLALLDLRNKDAQAALGHINAGLAKHPSNVRLLQVQAATLMTLNQPDKAVDALRAILRASPSNASAQRALADLESQNGHFDQAVESFRTALAADPDNEDMQLAFVQFLASQRKETDLVDYLQKMTARYPDKSIYDLILAEHYRSGGDLRRSFDVLSAAQVRLTGKVADRDVLTALAKVQAQAGRIDLAQADLGAVLAADPQNEGALLFRSTLAIEGGREGAAVTDLLTVLRVNPVSGRAYEQLASAYLQQGDTKLAADAMRRATAVLSGNVPAQVRLATFMQNTGNLADARNIMTQLTLSEPDNPQVWAANGQLAVARKELSIASRSLMRLRELPGAETAATILNGQILAAQGDNAAAVTSFKSAINTSPAPGGDLVGWFALASAGAGQAGDAANFLSGKVTSLAPAAQANVWPAIMTLRADAHDYDGALDAFRRASAISPLAVVLYGDASKILAAQGKLDQARQVLQDGISAGVPKWSMSLMMGFIDTAANDSNRAMNDYKVASDANPASVLAANNYATLLADAEPQNVEALTDARNRLSGQESSLDSSVLDTIAWLDYRLHRFDEAKTLLTRIDAKTSESAQRRFHLAAVLLAGGEKEAGLALLDTVKGANFPGSGEVSTLAPS